MPKTLRLSASAKEIKNAILAELAAEKAARPPELSEEPTFDIVSAAYERLAQTDTTVEPLTATVDALRAFIREVFTKLVNDSCETMNDEILDDDAFDRKHRTAGAFSEKLPEKKKPQEVLSDIRGNWERVMIAVEDGIAEKTTVMLNDRICADRHSLVKYVIILQLLTLCCIDAQMVVLSVMLYALALP